LTLLPVWARAAKPSTSSAAQPARRTSGVRLAPTTAAAMAMPRVGSSSLIQNWLALTGLSACWLISPNT
jgi:hypothetical protein